MHKGSTYLEVLRNHPDYYHSKLKEEKPSTMLEAWLVWVYRNFDVPPVGGGGPTLRAATEADTLQKARKAVTLDKAPKSKLGLLRADPKALRGRARVVAQHTHSTGQEATPTL